MGQPHAARMALPRAGGAPCPPQASAGPRVVVLPALSCEPLLSLPVSSSWWGSSCRGGGL